MNYSDIVFDDTMNGPGMRTTLFVSGCRHKCKGCFNEQTWDFNYGNPFDQSTLQSILLAVGQDHIQGLSILGGEPLDPRNVSTVEHIVRAVKDCFPNKDIWVWTGSTRSELQSRQDKHNVDAADLNSILQKIDVLIDGRFEQGLADSSLEYRGSSNQNVIYLGKA